jgi:putative hydrolase of HD superfamily
LVNLTRMKAIPRSGWLSQSVSLQDVESVADHTFSTCVLSMLLADLEVKRGIGINVEDVLRMAVLHDLAESLTFDISRAHLEWMGRNGEIMKRNIERSAWERIRKDIKKPELARKFATVQNQYVANETKEAKIVHAADSMDILLQIVDYERRGYPHALLSDLWNEQVKMVIRSGVASARVILKEIADENRKFAGNRKVI